MATEKKSETVDLFDPKNEKKAKYFKRDVVGNSVVGVYVAKEVRPNRLKPGVNQTIYTLVQDDGDVVLVAGSQGKKVQVLSGLESARFGERVGVKYTGDKPATAPGMNATKIVQVYSVGEMKMDVLEEWQSRNNPIPADTEDEEAF